MCLVGLYRPCNFTPVLLYVTREIGNREEEMDGTGWLTVWQMKERQTEKQRMGGGVISNCLQTVCGRHQIRIQKCLTFHWSDLYFSPPSLTLECTWSVCVHAYLQPQLKKVLHVCFNFLFWSSDKVFMPCVCANVCMCDSSQIRFTVAGLF